MIQASSQEIFKAFENPELLAKWWGPAGFTSTFHTFEFKENGIWSFVMHGPDGANYQNESIFLEIIKPHKIIIRHNCQPFFTLTIDIQDLDDGALVEFHQDFDSEEFANSMMNFLTEANKQVLERLSSIVTKAE